jgi:TetR/AcrR family tetracycline transcriptional repressor
MVVNAHVRPSPTRRRGGTQVSPLTVDDVIAAALRIVAADGLDAVSIKGLAFELGVTSPAIYHYVRGLDDVVLRVCERVASLTPLDERPGLIWDEQIVAMLLDMHETFRRYPGVGLRVLSLDGPAPAAERMASRMITIMRGAGFSAAEAKQAVSTLYFYFSGWLLDRPPFLPGGERNQVRMNRALLDSGVRLILRGLASRQT